MSRLACREKALALRKEGKSYSQIKTVLDIPKSTLSNWLNKYPLSKERIRLLRDINEIRIERFRETMRRKKVAKLMGILEHSKKELLPLSYRELFLCGLFLYLGEGSKVAPSKLSITNSDPGIIKFTLFWFTKILKIPKDKIHVDLQLYKDMDIKKQLNFWHRELQIPLKNFSKPYIKDTTSYRINHKGSFGHGTCAISFYNVKMKDEIMMGLKAIMDRY